MNKAIDTIIKIGNKAVANLTSIGGMELSADTLETTVLGGGAYRTFMQGLKDGGEVSVSGYFTPSNDGQSGLYNAFDSGTEDQYSIIFPPDMGAQWDFAGVVTGYTTGAELEDLVSFEATIKVSGKPSLGLTPSAGPSALALTGTGGTLAPAFAAGTSYYTFATVTGTSVTVTVTAANHEILLFVNDVFFQKLASAAASGTIAVSAGSKKLTVIVREPGKTSKSYEIVVVK